jgi:hypothetical protein
MSRDLRALLELEVPKSLSRLPFPQRHLILSVYFRRMDTLGFTPVYIIYLHIYIDIYVHVGTSSATSIY